MGGKILNETVAGDSLSVPSLPRAPETDTFPVRGWRTYRALIAKRSTVRAFQFVLVAKGLTRAEVHPEEIYLNIILPGAQPGPDTGLAQSGERLWLSSNIQPPIKMWRRRAAQAQIRRDSPVAVPNQSAPR